MSEELLQNNEPTEEIIENPEGSELATEKEEAPKEPTPEEVEAEKEAKTTAAFNKQYGKTKQAERELATANAELQQFRQAQVVAPEQVGNFPNEYDFDTTEDFDRAKTAFVNNVQANANYTATQNALLQQQQSQQQVEFQQKQEVLNEKAQTFMAKAKSYGISQDEVAQFANTVIGQYGISDNAREAIISQPEGVLMLKHLAANPQDVGKLNAMNPYEAGAFIAGELNQKAVELKPKQTSTPPPTDDIEGGSVNTGDKYLHLGRAKFE